MTQWRVSTLGEECDLYQPKTISMKEMKASGEFPVYGANGQIGFFDKFNHEDSQVLLSCRGNCGTVNVSRPKSWINGNAMVCAPKTADLSKEFLAYFLQSVDWKPVITGTAQPQITRQPLAKVALPVPPMDEQRQIVKTLDDHLSRLDKALAEVDQGRKREKSFKQSLLHSVFENLDAAVFELGDVSKPRYGKDVPKHLRSDSFTYPVVGSAGVMTFTEVPLVDEPSILVGRKGNVGAVQMFDTPCSPVDTAYYLTCPDDVDLEFMYFQLQSIDLKSLDSSTTIPSLRRQDLEVVPFRKPDLATQKNIALEIKTKLASIDAALNQLESISSSLLLLRRSLLNAAFTGNLLKGIR